MLWFEFFILLSKHLVGFEAIRSTQGNILNYKTSIVGGLIIIKNLLYWFINFWLILISNIILKFYKILTNFDKFKIIPINIQ